jgi:hypothetical protein
MGRVSRECTRARSAYIYRRLLFGFAQLGALKCEQTLQYWLNRLEKEPQCPGNDYEYHLKGGGKFALQCVAKELALPHAVPDEL